MRFPFEVVGVGKQNITGKSHIKYEDNMVLKIETNDLKTDFRCESYALTFTNKLFYEVTHFYKKKQGSLLQ
jgi:hypothetical protein